MDILNTVIELMSKEELRNFKLFATRSHDKKERKDLQLFEYIRKSGSKFNETKILKRLYGGSSHKNTYYRLRNRLLTEINKSVSLLHWEKDETVIALHYLGLARVYMSKQHYRLTHYYLRKAEQKAAPLDRLELLDMIYSEFITLSFELIDINPEDYIEKRKKNRIKLNQLREIDNILAAMTYRLRRSQNLFKGDNAVQVLLESVLAEFSQNEEIMADPKFRLRMYQAVSKILLQNRDYEALETYLRGTYKAFVEEDFFNKSNHDIRLQMLTYLINTLFKNGKTVESLAYAEHLWEGMQQFGRLHHDKYLFFYYNALVVNYSTTDIGKAIVALEEMLKNEQIARTPTHLLYIYFNLALSEYARQNNKAALRHIVKLRLQDAFATTEQGFHFRLDIFELALRYELRDYETLQYRIAQFRNDYLDLMQDAAYEKDAKMVNLIDRMNETVDVRKDSVLRADIQHFLDTYASDDTEIFKYDEFLQPKI